MIRPYLLDNSFRHYSWGSLDGIAAFLSRPNAERVPCAEYWMGSHATAPSMVEHDGKRLSLGELIAEYPDVLLGANTASRFDGKLPFLFKILSAAAPLSLQVHPDKAQAERGFALEDKAGIHLDSPLRNYKDRNHKPELLTAITAFRALCGFREHGETLALLSSCEADVLKPAIDVLSESREYPAFYRYLLEMPNRARRELTDVIVRLAHDPQKSLALATPDEGLGFPKILELAGELATEYPGDVGCLAPFFLNIVDLEPGQSLYLYSGILHTYIKGTGLELMASSDNVLRGGLTDKHIDIPEFLSILDARPYYPSIIQPIPDGCRRIVPTPAADFELSIIESSGEICPLPEGRPSILLCAEGDFRFSHSADAGEEILGQALQRGSSFFIPACIESLTVEGRGRCYLASVPRREGGRMILWIDADSCPRQVRDLVCRTSSRLGLPLYFVANRIIPGPASPLFKMIVADAKPDAADDYIVENAAPRDLVITRDIPLAKRLVELGISVINDRGVAYTAKNIDERLSMRNFMLELYNNGISPERTGVFGRKELQEFANALDREITRLSRP